MPEDLSAAPPDARLVRLEGTMSFRDLGGWRTVEGRSVAWRKVYRSDHPPRPRVSLRARFPNPQLGAVWRRIAVSVGAS